MSTWKIATVQLNYHIAVDKMNYSVPYEYIKCKVDVRLTASMVEVFYQTVRIASHRRLSGHPGQYSTVIEHMPEKHRQYAKWNAERLLKWAFEIGPYTLQTIKAVISSKKVEEQSYKTCIALMKLADTYSVERLEGACEKALSYVSIPSFRSIRTILKTGSDRNRKETDAINPDSDTAAIQRFGAFTRGAAYYGEFLIQGERYGE